MPLPKHPFLKLEKSLFGAAKEEIRKLGKAVLLSGENAQGKQEYFHRFETENFKIKFPFACKEADGKIVLEIEKTEHTELFLKLAPILEMTIQFNGAYLQKSKMKGTVSVDPEYEGKLAVSALDLMEQQLKRKNGQSFVELTNQISFWNVAPKRFKESVWHMVLRDPRFKFNRLWAHYKNSPLWLRKK